MVENFYNQLAPQYKNLYQDWDESIAKQASTLDRVIKEYFGDRIKTIRDVACGIGTQALGLSELGYRVIGSDISPDAIDLAQKEAELRNLKIDFSVMDLRKIIETEPEPVDLVLACDNVIPHLMSKKEILRTFKSFYKIAAPEGGCLISVRDYAQLKWEAGEIRLVPRLVRQIDDGKIIVFDVWEFSADAYEITVYILEDVYGEELKITAAKGGQYFCVGIDTLEYLFLQAGFRKVVTIRDRYFQPLILAKKG
jgi:SAM-dependent methyltransferase